jgi:predicted RNA-binding Zn ribbon-like protein
MTGLIDIAPEPRHRQELFVAFANTLAHQHGARVETLPDADALLRWLRDHDLISDRARATEAAHLRREESDAARWMGRFAHLRGLLHGIAARVSAGKRPTGVQVRELNHILRHGLHYHQLQLEADGSHYTVAQIGDRLDQARAIIASSLAHFLAEEAPDRLRVCDNPACREIFVDHSPTGRRRWCDMRTCGNQAKVARHRARQRAMPNVAPPAGGAPADLPVRPASV